MSTHSLESLDDSVAGSSDGYYDSDEEESLARKMAQEEWEESLDQLHLVLSVVAMPFLGKWLGRRWSQWGEHCLSLPFSFMP